MPGPPYDVLAIIGTHKDGATFGAKLDTPQEMYAHIHQSLTTRYVGDFIPNFCMHQLSGWPTIPEGEGEMSASEYRAMPRLLREALVDAVDDARRERPEIRVSIYGSLNIGSPFTVEEPAHIYDPYKVDDRVAMFDDNIDRWREDLGSLGWYIDNGSWPYKPGHARMGKRFNSVVLAWQLRDRGIMDVGVEGIPVLWMERQMPNGNVTPIALDLERSMLQHVRGINDLAPWSEWWESPSEMPACDPWMVEQSQCTIYLRRVWDDDVDPAEWLQAAHENGYRLGSDRPEYDEIVKDVLGA